MSMVDAGFLADARTIFIGEMIGSAIVQKKASETSTRSNPTGGDGFGGVSPTIGGSTTGDGFVTGNTYPARLTQSPTRFNVAEQEIANSATGRVRSYMALPRNADVGLQDRIIYSDPDQTAITVEVIAIDPHAQGLTLGLIVQELE